MAHISLDNMRFRAHHGLYEEERLIGNDFILDVLIDANIHFAEVIVEHETEKVVNTVNYELVYEICRIEMGKSHQLLESVVELIAYRLKRHFPNMNLVQIKLRKLNPPIGGLVESASITELKQFQKECAKCSNPMICYKEGRYKDGTCWCEQEGAKDRIHPRTQELIEQQYKGNCLCVHCLKAAEG
jgi:7,8-dihydroneopterin aldolase/epimerase/oxygenase